MSVLEPSYVIKRRYG